MFLYTLYTCLIYKLKPTCAPLRRLNFDIIITIMIIMIVIVIVVILKDPKEEVNTLQEVKEEPSDIEEGGLDLTVPFKPISAYVSDRQEMLEQCLRVLGQNKLKKMLPDELKVFLS